jgi:hypothetical protein
MAIVAKILVLIAMMFMGLCQTQAWSLSSSPRSGTIVRPKIISKREIENNRIKIENAAVDREYAIDDAVAEGSEILVSLVEEAKAKHEESLQEAQTVEVVAKKREQTMACAAKLLKERSAEYSE